MQLRRRRRAELDRQRSRDELAHVARVSTMGQLASTLAHELSQPLGAILRNCEAAELFLQKNPPDHEEVKAILTDIRQDDQRAGAVIDRMRAMLKRRDLQLEPLGLRELCERVAALAHTELEARRVELHVELPSDLPPVQGDRVQLQQVLLNLLINGAEATNGSPTERQRLVLRARQTDNQHVEVSVSDAGQGIPVDKLTQIFEPFFTTKVTGMGMGLAISQTIVNAHGGRMWAENNPDGGATVRFTVKVTRGEAVGRANSNQ
jgi:two-component system sensor kinase FixL